MLPISPLFYPLSSCDAETPGPRTAEYEAIYRLSVAIILSWAIGVPVAYLALLVSVRDALHHEQPTPLSSALEFLHQEYEPHVYFWEIVDASKKLVLVGFLSLPPLPGTTTQLVAAFVFSICFLVLQMQAAPYRRHEDDFLAMACSDTLWSICFMSRK